MLYKINAMARQSSRWQAAPSPIKQVKAKEEEDEEEEETPGGDTPGETPGEPENDHYSRLLQSSSFKVVHSFALKKESIKKLDKYSVQQTPMGFTRLDNGWILAVKDGNLLNIFDTSKGELESIGEVDIGSPYVNAIGTYGTKVMVQNYQRGLYYFDAAKIVEGNDDVI